MQDYPQAARAFIKFIGGFGLVVILLCGWLPTSTNDHFSLFSVILVSLIATIVGGWKIPWIPSKKNSEASSISLGLVITFVALLAFGLRAGVYVGVLANVGAGLWPRRQPLHQLIFNVATAALTVCAGGCIWQLLNDTTTSGFTVRTGVAFVGTAGTYFLINTGCVATVVALCKGQQPLTLWREQFLKCAPSYVAAAFCAILGQQLFRSNPLFFLLLLPVLGGTYIYARGYSKRHKDSKGNTADAKSELGKGNAASPSLRVARCLLILMPPQKRKNILGDMEEEYVQMHGDKGKQVTRRWYWQQVAGLLRSGLYSRLARLLRALRSASE